MTRTTPPSATTPPYLPRNAAGRRRRAAAIAAFAVSILGAAVAGPGIASAATYDVVACQAAADDGFANNSWTAVNTAPTFFATGTSCPTSGGQLSGINVGERLEVVGFTPNGSGAGMRFTAPEGTTISAITYSRYLGQWSDNSKVPGLRDDTGAVVGGETCVFDGWASECSLGSSSPAIAFKTITGLNTRSLTAGVTCQANAPATGCGGSTRYGTNSWFSVYGATVTLSQTTAPTVTASSLSSAWSRTVPTPSMSAADVSGIRRARLYVDGSRVTDQARPCDFTRVVPCTDLSTVQLPLGTLADGTHTVAVAAVNSAGLETTAAAQTIRLDRTAPPPPVHLTTTAGDGWGTNPTVTATWTLPSESDAAPIVAATYSVCDDTGSCTTPRPTDTPTTTTVQIPHEGTYETRVWLTDGAGNTDPAASSDVRVRLATTAPAAPLSIVADAAGQWQRTPTSTLGWRLPDVGIGAPIGAALITLCDSDGRCSPEANANGLTDTTVALPREGTFTARVWLRNVAGIADATRASSVTLRYDATPPPPPRPVVEPADATAPTFRAHWSNPAPDAGSPYLTTRWTLCQAQTCSPEQTTSEGTAMLVAPGPGQWTFRAHHLDSAGNLSSAGEATFTYRLPTRPPDEPDPPTRRPATLRSPNLRLGRPALRRGLLSLAIRSDRTISARATATLTFRIGSSSKRLHRTVRIQNGKATLRVRLPAATTRATIQVQLSSTSVFRAQLTSTRFSIRGKAIRR